VEARCQRQYPKEALLGFDLRLVELFRSIVVTRDGIGELALSKSFSSSAGEA
jgi:hypothetical protein